MNMQRLAIFLTFMACRTTSTSETKLSPLNTAKKPTAPQNLTLTLDSLGNMIAKWDAADHATSYRLYISKSDPKLKEETSIRERIRHRQETIYSPEPNRTYYVAVSSFGRLGESPLSEIRSIKVRVPAKLLRSAQPTRLDQLTISPEATIVFFIEKNCAPQKNCVRAIRLDKILGSWVGPELITELDARSQQFPFLAYRSSPESLFVATEDGITKWLFSETWKQELVSIPGPITSMVIAREGQSLFFTQNAKLKEIRENADGSWGFPQEVAEANQVKSAGPKHLLLMDGGLRIYDVDSKNSHFISKAIDASAAEDGRFIVSLDGSGVTRSYQSTEDQWKEVESTFPKCSPIVELSKLGAFMLCGERVLERATPTWKEIGQLGELAFQGRFLTNSTELIAIVGSHLYLWSLRDGRNHWEKIY